MRTVSGIILAGFALALLGTMFCQGTSVTAPKPQTSVGAKSELVTPDVMRDKAIIAVFRWDVSDEDGKAELLCVFRRFDQDPEYEGKGTKFSVYSKGAMIYQELFSELAGFYPVSALRTGPTQLAVELDYGGSGTNYLQLLDYHDGKVRNLLDPKDGEFNVLAEIKPQFRSGVLSWKEPFEIRLTRGVGLASPVEKLTTVYRYQGRKYVSVGRYSQKALDDYVEQQLKRE